MEVGDVLIADKWCGFPDYTTKGKEYTVCKVEKFTDREIFWIIDDNGQKRFPISTTFKRKCLWCNGTGYDQEHTGYKCLDCK